MPKKLVKKATTAVTASNDTPVVAHVSAPAPSNVTPFVTGMSVLDENSENALFSKENVLTLGQQYAALSEQIKMLDERKKKLAVLLKEGAEKFGVKNDKGGFYLEDDNIVVGKQAKKSISINQDKAVKVLESVGLGDVVDVVTVKSVNEDKLTSAISEGRISLTEVEKFTDTKTSYAVDVKVKSAMPEVQQTSFSAAARMKK